MLTLTQVQDILSVKISGDFIENELKVAPAKREKRAIFWEESQLPAICDQLILHLNAVKGGKRIAPKEKKAAAPGLDDLF